MLSEIYSYTNSQNISNNLENNKTIRLHQVKLKKIDASIEESKQNVAKHILLSRSLENARKQAIQIEQGLQLRIAKSLGLSEGKYERYLAMISSQCFAFELTDLSIYVIQQASMQRISLDTKYLKDPSIVFPSNIGKLIYEAYVSYKSGETISFISNQLINDIQNNDHLEVLAYFNSFERNVSKHCISHHELTAIYRKAIWLSQYYSDHHHHSTKCCMKSPSAILKDLLMKKLFHSFVVRYVTESCHQYQQYISSSALELERVPNNQIMQLHNSSSHNKINWGNNSTKLKSESSRKNRQEHLNNSLDRSKAKETNINKKIVDSISSMYGTNLIPLEAIRSHKKALEKFQTIAIDKLFVGLQVLYIRYMRYHLLRWRKSVEVINIGIICNSFLKHTAAHRILQVLELNCAKSLQRAMNSLKSIITADRDRERLIAVVDVQRYWRGSLQRHRSKSNQLSKAAIKMQSIARMLTSKRKVADRKRIQFLKRHVLIIENKWKTHVWNRTLNKLFKSRLMNRSARNIQRIYRGHRGKLHYKEINLIRLKHRGAIKFQTIWLRYKAILTVALMLNNDKGKQSAILIQKKFRGYLARIIYKGLLRIHQSAKIIQYFFLRMKALKERNRRLRIKSAIKIQTFVRSRQGRKLFQYLKRLKMAKESANWNAIAFLAPIILGYATRRKWKEIIKANTMIRHKNARIIQILLRALMLGYKARMKVARIRAEHIRNQKRIKAAIEIQRIQRGIMGRLKFLLHQEKWIEEQEKAKHRMPQYYRLKAEYYKNQNIFHRRYLLTIQCTMRCRLARNKVWRQRRYLAACIIQRLVKGYVRVKLAKRYVQNVRLAKQKLNFYVRCVQKVIRGFLGRKKFRRHKLRDIIVWFLREVHLKMLARNAILSYRAKKNFIQLQKNASVKIQSIVRRRQATAFVKRSYKKLARMRQFRNMDKRNKAAITIQCMIRCHKARNRVRKQREILDKKNREDREYEELENSLAGLHEEFIQELYHIRAQKGARALLAKKEFIEKVAKHKKELERKALRIKDDAAIKIQALIRGVVSRIRHKKNLPNLKRAYRARQVCVECETQIAVKRCRQCKDRYCQACYDKVHAKGNRRSHGWDRIAKPVNIAMDEQQNVSKTTNNATKENVKKQDWEEFYDASARAKYWFNKVTGEASWINPLV